MCYRLRGKEETTHRKETKMFENLLKIKSIITIVCLGLFAYCVVSGKINGEQLLVVFSTIIGFYFGTQKGKEK